jgi:hypothetical protein
MTILALDPGLCDCGWAVVAPRTGKVAALGLIHQDRNPKLDESTCRARRLRHQATALYEIAIAHGCTAIAAEAMSFGGPPKARFSMAISIGLSWGGLAGVAAALELELYEVPPKLWQHAVLDLDIGARCKVDYDDVFRTLSDFVQRGTAAWSQLSALRGSRRNHALDAVGVGVFTALRPNEATRIGGKSPQ